MLIYCFTYLKLVHYLVKMPVTSVHYIFISDCLTTEQKKATRESLNCCIQLNKVPTLAIINKAIK